MGGVLPAAGENSEDEDLLAKVSTACDELKDRFSQYAAVAALEAVRDPEAQFAVAFETLAGILREAGAQLSDIVEITSYHVGISAHMEAFMRVWARYLKEPYPAWTAVGVAELIVPGGLVEIRAVAAERMPFKRVQRS